MKDNELIINKEIDNWIGATLHKAINNSFKDYNIQELKELNLVHNSDKIVELLSQLPSVDTFKFLKFIDNALPGISFHYIMECVNFVYNLSDLCQQKLLFSFRASYYLACFPEKQMLAPMRTRLCHGLLFSDIKTTFFLDFQEKMHDVDKRQFIAKEDRSKIKKDLYLRHFREYIYKITVESLEDYEDDECYE